MTMNLDYFLMGKTYRRDSDHWPKQQRRAKRRNNKNKSKEISSSRYNTTEDYTDISYLSEYSNFERFDRKKRK
jgi:hypothetical protein